MFLEIRMKPENPEETHMDKDVMCDSNSHRDPGAIIKVENTDRIPVVHIQMFLTF